MSGYFFGTFMIWILIVASLVYSNWKLYQANNKIIQNFWLLNSECIELRKENIRLKRKPIGQDETGWV